jgi:Cornifin (SPRR) family
MYLGWDEKLHPGGMVPEKPSYVSRFALKFSEILGAGLATAVSGYLVAHLGGYLSWPMKAPAPAAVVETLSSGGSKTAEPPRTSALAPVPKEANTSATAHDYHGKELAAPKAAEASAPATTGAAAPASNEDKRSRGPTTSHKAVSEPHPAKPAPRETADTKARETAEAKAREAAEAKARETADAKAREAADAKAREAADAKAREAADAKAREAADAKARETAAAKARETAAAKAREEQAVEDQVRAALANVDASRAPVAPLTPPAATTSPAPRTPAIPPPQPLVAPANAASTKSGPGTGTGTASATVQPARPAQPLNAQNAASVAAAAPSAPVAVPAAQAPPAQPGPLTTVEIKSLPVAGIAETSPAAPASAQAENEPDHKTKEASKGFFSAITHLPDMLRADAPGPGTEPPRPPLPVGQ